MTFYWYLLSVRVVLQFQFSFRIYSSATRALEGSQLFIIWSQAPANPGFHPVRTQPCPLQGMSTRHLMGDYHQAAGNVLLAIQPITSIKMDDPYVDIVNTGILLHFLMADYILNTLDYPLRPVSLQPFYPILNLPVFNYLQALHHARVRYPIYTAVTIFPLHQTRLLVEHRFVFSRTIFSSVIN